MTVECQNCPAFFDFSGPGMSELDVIDMLTEHNLDVHKVPYAETKRTPTKYFRGVME